MSPEEDKDISDLTETVECMFSYSYPTCTREDIKFNLEAPITVPFPNSAVREYVMRLMNMLHIPAYLEDDLIEKLTAFATEETRKYENRRDEALLARLRGSSGEAENAVKRWERLYRQHITEYADQKPTADEEVFAAAYHKLIHTPAHETILQVENAYAGTVKQTLDNRQSDIEKLTQRQTEEMEQMLKTLNITTTEEEINALAGRHFEEQSMVAGRWASQVDALCHTQRAQYRTWLMQVLEEQQTNSAVQTPSNSPLGTFPPPSLPPPPPPPPPRPHLDESFTIHLGSQLKQMHNVRITCADALKPCRSSSHQNADTWRLQSSLSLYSSELCGLVLLSDSPPSRPAALTRQLMALCRESTDHHFPDIDEQIARIVEEVKEPVERRNVQRFKEQSESPYSEPTRKKQSKNMQTGDLYITRHSNLAEVHVVFHMVVDESSLKSGDINSRHLAILGLRNILKTACSNDVTTLSIPLLLTHDIIDEMTVAWCVKRAELVLKCVKGFMMEMASWGGSELKNVIFVAPENISEEVFRALASLFPAIFRVSNPLKFKAAC